MMKEELRSFYKEDKRFYDLKENKKFLIMFNHLIDEGYNLFIGIDDMQDLIDRLFNWYEIKYPEREFDFYDGEVTLDFAIKKELSDLMDINQLLFRLTDNQVKFLRGNYRSKDEMEYFIYDGNVKVGTGVKVIFKIGRNSTDRYYLKYKDFIVRADAVSGVLDIDYEVLKYVDADNITLDDLFKNFSENYSDKLEFKELEDAINDKFIDNYLRDKLLEFVSLKLLYSKQTIPERGYVRAKRFIDEFNKKLDLSLTYDEIDKVMNNYKENKSKIKTLSF